MLDDGMTDKKRLPRSAAKETVMPFPPLPPLPSPPRLPIDTRQARTSTLLGRIARTATATMQVAGPNLVHGFHASAVHLGSLQSALARGIARLDRIQVKERWDEIFEWMQHLIRTWVQRCKMMRVKRRATGIRVELETQDDYGYYTYGFDVFPGRETRPSRARKHGVPKK